MNRTREALRPAIIVLEDDEVLRNDIVLPGLTDFGFDVTGVGTANELYKCFIRTSFDVAVLDIGIPDESGLEVINHLRHPGSDIGVVMLTADRDRDKYITALTRGADAFLSKPVDMEVLALTLRNLCGRLVRLDAETGAESDDWRLESSGWCLVAPGGQVAALSASERSVMVRLFEHRGHVVEREALIAALTEDVIEFDPHRLEMLIYRVRNKAAKITHQDRPKLPLLSSRGAGYLIAT